MVRKLIYSVCFVLVLGLLQMNVAYGYFPDDDPDMLGWWECNEGEGATVSDSSGNDNHGTFVNGNPSWVEGVRGTSAVELVGPTLVEIPALNVTLEEATMAGWIKANGSQPEWASLIMMRPTATGFNVLGLQLAYHWNDASNTYSYRGGDMIADNEWTFAAVIVLPDRATFYVNGVQGSTNTVSHPPVAWNANIYLGGDGSGDFPGRQMNGALDDVSFWSRALTTEEIVILMKGLSDPAVATAPNPENEASDMPRDLVLSWTPGKDAQTHDVYLGTVFNDVNDADRDNPLDVLLSQNQDANNYDAGRLELGQIYYWRVDEVQGGGTTINKGDVWSFTVEPLAYPIEDITVTASSNEEEKEPENTVNGSGLDESGLLHNNVGDGNMWLSNREGDQPTWIQYEFDKVYKLYEMWVWNSNETLESVIGLGFRDVTIEYSINGTDYITLGTTHEFAQASGNNDYAHNTTIDFGDLSVKYVRLTANSNWGGLLNQYGLSEVRFFQIPVHVKEPSPASGAVDVALEPTLSWRAGREAAEHKIYISDDEQAVIDGTADVTTVSDTSYGPLSLDLGKTYYWRVDEVNGTDVWQGDVWNFRTHEYFVIDDFEDYNDSEPDRIFETWEDGWASAMNGSTAGYPNPSFPDGEHFAETAIVHSGAQAMPYFYNNNAGNSEATLTLSSLRNWAEKGISRLVLWFRGNAPGLFEDPAGTYTINASGADIWETADEFRYVFKQLSGPGSIIARVESVEDTDEWAKAGVMIRESLDPSSKFAAVYITPTNGCRFQARLTIVGNATADDSVVTAEQTAITAPYWVKIERDDADNFNGYYSSDGVNWVAMLWNPQNIAMPADVYIGLAVTSHNPGVTCTAVFSNVQTTGTVSPQMWMQKAIGVEMPSNEAEQMYVVLDDSAVVYHDNPNATLTDEWTEWSIELSAPGGFADQGVDLTDVDTLGIGFGDRDNPQPGGSGVVYFDDIRLYSPEPPEPEGLTLENPSFELPGTEKQTGFDNVPGWSSDTEVADSGVESDWPGSTDGAWTAFMMGSDPSAWNLTDHVIASGDEFLCPSTYRTTGRMAENPRFSSASIMMMPVQELPSRAQP